MMKFGENIMLLIARRFLLLLAFLTLPAMAQEPVIIDGEAFTRKFVGNPPNGDKLLEFVREGESFGKWTRLVAYRYQKLPAADNDPKRVASLTAQSVKARHPESGSRVIVNEKTGEALVDFLIRSPDGEFMEFNVFRYVRSPDGGAVVSLQMAHRFDDVSAEGTERFRKLRESWISQAIAFDMNRVHAALGSAGD
jgi:hypothetical protein